MLQRRDGCTCSTGAIPVGLELPTGYSAERSAHITGSRRGLDTLTEIKLQPNDFGPWYSVDDDLRRINDASTTTVLEEPLQPELDVVPAPGSIVALVRQ